MGIAMRTNRFWLVHRLKERLVDLVVAGRYAELVGYLEKVVAKPRLRRCVFSSHVAPQVLLLIKHSGGRSDIERVRRLLDVIEPDLVPPRPGALAYVRAGLSRLEDSEHFDESG